MSKRITLEVNYDGTNRIQHLYADGSDIYEALENMLQELDDFKNEYENNNMKTGGNIAFTDDALKLYNELDDIRAQINEILGGNE